jgi:hypothetical protein
MLRRIVFAMFLLTQAFGLASVVNYDPIPICDPCSDAR